MQYRLRTLFIATTIAAVLCATIAPWSYKARQQREAVSAFREIGGWVRYDFESSKLQRPPHWPAWLVNQVGVDYFACVTSLNLDCTQSLMPDLNTSRASPR